MAEETESGFDTGEGDEGHFSDDMEMVKGNPEALAFAKKYNSAEECIMGGQNAEAKIGSSFRLPEDPKNLTDEQKGEILGYAKKFRDVPEKADGYEFEIPEGLPKNEALDKAFRAFAHERGWDKKDVKELMGFYHSALIAGREAETQKSVTDAAEARTQFQLLCASKGKTVEAAEENIKRIRFQAATELGLTYDTGTTDDNGNPIIGSKLDDALDAKDVAGNRLGNQLPILQLLNYIHEKYEAEGVPVSASGGVEGGVSGAALSKDFYSKPTN